MDKRVWFKIGEMAEKVGVTPKELRYWEKVIPELCPRRSKGNLRYYHIEDLSKLLSIKQWLSEGYSVADCRKLMAGGEIQPRLISESLPEPVNRRETLLAELRSLRDRLACTPEELTTNGQAKEAKAANYEVQTKPKTEAENPDSYMAADERLSDEKIE